MSKVLIISALLCTVASHVVHADDVVEYHLENPVTLQSEGYLYTLWKTNTSIHLNSTKGNFQPCSITVDPVKDFAMVIQGKELPNHKFLLWGYRSYNASEPHWQGLVNANYTALIIDPLSCSYKAVDVPEDKISDAFLPTFNFHVVLSTDHFDFFSPGHGKCLPCRFSLEGESVPLGYQLELGEEIASPHLYDIINDVGSSKGYIYTANFMHSNTAVIKKLDGKFKVLKQVLLEHPIHSISINDNEQPVISVCYSSQSTADSFRYNNFSVHCEQLDADFNSKFTVRLPVPDDCYVFGLQGITHQVDSLGNMFTGLIQTKLIDPDSYIEQRTRQLRFFAIDKTGKLVGSRDYEEVNLAIEMFDLHSYILANKKFCIVFNVAVYKGSLNLYSDTHELIGCHDVSKYVK